ncbi:TPA: hypothetical protein ON570_005019, partial [Citrobacter werkmanii]|nr:hypothetical protein [Citrobacter werkmanii]
GMEPLITIGGDGYTVTNGGGTAVQTAKVKVTGLTDANDNTSTVEGEMTFKTVVAAVAGYQSGSFPSLYAQGVEGNNQKYSHPLSSTNADYVRSLDKAWANQKLSVDYASSAYAGLTGPQINTTATPPGFAFKGSSYKKVLGGVHSNIHSAKVTFPAATIPEVWEGALTVTVAYR